MTSHFRRCSILKLKPYIFTFLLSLILSVACFGFSNKAVRTATASVDVEMSFVSGQIHLPSATAVDIVESRLEPIDASVPAAVGKMILNVHRSEIAAVEELQGYVSGPFKPNIEIRYAFTSSTKGFKGLATNHFARAGV